MAEDFMLSVGLIADTDELEDQVQDADLQSDVNIDGDGAGTGGGGAGFTGGGFLAAEEGGFLAGGTLRAAAIAGILAVLISQLEPIQELLNLLVRQVELFIIPFIRPLTPLLNEISGLVAQFVQFTRDPTGFLDSGPMFADRGDVVGGGGSLSGPQSVLASSLGNMFMPGIGGLAQGGSTLIETSPESLKERLGSTLEGILDDEW